jgi:hypothetical protein
VFFVFSISKQKKTYREMRGIDTLRRDGIGAGYVFAGCSARLGREGRARVEEVPEFDA